MKKHQFEVFLQELAASEKMPGWQDALHEMLVKELAAARSGDIVQEKNIAAN